MGNWIAQVSLALDVNSADSANTLSERRLFFKSMFGDSLLQYIKHHCHVFPINLLSGLS